MGIGGPDAGKRRQAVADAAITGGENVRAFFEDRLFRCCFWAIAALYAYGALVHVMNIVGLSGFAWLGAPLKWQVLDIVYLGLDVAIVACVFRRTAAAVPLLAIAALSQILLYTLGRPWVLDVPNEYRPAPSSVAYLDGLVIFHAATLAVLVTLLLRGRPTR